MLFSYLSCFNMRHYISKSATKKIRYLIYLTIIIIVLKKFFDQEEEKGAEKEKDDIVINPDFDYHISFVSATYYNNASFHPPSTIALLFRAPVNLVPLDRWKCITKNILTGETNISSLTYRKAVAPYPNLIDCRVITYIGTCQSIYNPSSLHLGDPKDFASAVELPLRRAVTQRLPVVSCLCSVFLAESAQPLVTAIETMAHFGVSRQVYRFMSGHQSIFEMLTFYESSGLISLEYTALPPNEKDIWWADWLYVRDQVSELNDCYLKYREAADFIFVHDYDDIIIFPPGYKSYHETVKSWFETRPLTSYFHFYTYNSYLRSADALSDFSLADALKTAWIGPDIGDHTHHGKSVFNTSLVESVDVHSAYGYNESLSMEVKNMTEGFVFHARTWIYNASMNHAFKPKIKENTTNSMYPRLLSAIGHAHIDAIDDAFQTRLAKMPRDVTKLVASQKYFDALEPCVYQINFPEYPIKGCRTHVKCPLPEIPDFTCIQIYQPHQRADVHGGLMVSVPSGNPKLEFLKDGCKH